MPPMAKGDVSELNVTALLRVMRIVAPKMTEQGRAVMVVAGPQHCSFLML